jgi:hypothetical protein
MKNRLILLMLLGLVLAIDGIGFKIVFSKIKQEQLKKLDNAPDLLSIDWQLRRAKLTEEKEVTLPGFFRCFAEVKDLNQALAHYKVISAIPIERCVTTETLGLVTWYKFKIIDELSSERLQEGTVCGDASNEADCLPAVLLPLEGDEILISHIGGDVIIDGIRIWQAATIYWDFATASKPEPFYLKPPLSQAVELSQAHQYLSHTKPFLLFVSASKSGKLAGLSLGERGIFSFDANNELEAVSAPDTYHVIKADLERLKINSSEKLKAYAQHSR